MSIPTTTISARVPIQVHEELKAYCKAAGITVSQYIQDIFTSKNGDIAIPEPDMKVDNSTRNLLLQLSGGSLSAIYVYKLVKGSLPEKFPDLTDVQIEMIAMGAGVATGIAISWGISKLLEDR